MAEPFFLESVVRLVVVLSRAHGDPVFIRHTYMQKQKLNTSYEVDCTLRNIYGDGAAVISIGTEECVRCIRYTSPLGAIS